MDYDQHLILHHLDDPLRILHWIIDAAVALMAPAFLGLGSEKPFSVTYGALPVLSEKGETQPEGENSELNEALSKLSILQEIQNDLRASGSTTTLPLIFKGCEKSCTIAFAGFKNCCTDGKREAAGWGVSLGLSGCGGEDKDLAERQQKGLCHEIGTFCAEKVLGVCIRKKRRSCCFPSKLARILHEQGRAQLGISWGSAESPDCRGFTEAAISTINFDQLNLSEIFAEVASRMKAPATDVVKRNLSERMGQMTHRLRVGKGEM